MAPTNPEPGPARQPQTRPPGIAGGPGLKHGLQHDPIHDLNHELIQDRRHIRLLSYNIQTGMASQRYRHYLTRGWRHVLPHSQLVHNLNRISGLLGAYDIVALQEVDAGSLRTGYINQTEYLAQRAGFPYWYSQTNRRLGHLAQISIGLLSHARPSQITEHRLPGAIPGRGLMVVRLGSGNGVLHLVIVHLSLGRRARRRQLAYATELIGSFRHVVVMGDFNAAADSPEISERLASTQLSTPIERINTFPSWRPRRGLDHILVSSGLEVVNTRVMQLPFSDHLPIAVELRLPDGLSIQPQKRAGECRPS